MKCCIAVVVAEVEAGHCEGCRLLKAASSGRPKNLDEPQESDVSSVSLIPGLYEGGSNFVTESKLLSEKIVNPRTDDVDRSLSFYRRLTRTFELDAPP